MYGKRARIGLIAPPTNTVIEAEFYRMTPEGVSIHTARPEWENPESTPESLIRMSGGVADAAQRVANAGVGVILWGCTSGSFVKGVGFDKELSSRIEDATNIEGLTT
ncbi:MAG: maleate cis-trans isomerase, partial [Nitrososphaeria archaeon]|nr:maleate cis-trans isomerase [Nitrososphaeria archaeon]NIQ33808.1 maleate cis-trans isomerase [Nitrososphaeria archaeon]